jgi:hypothetical protein
MSKPWLNMVVKHMLNIVANLMIKTWLNLS